MILRRPALAIFTLALFLLFISAAATATTIAEARQLPLGTVVTVDGSVTVPSGAFAASTFDQGFGIQDETAGIYVSTAENPQLNFHRLVRVTGTLDDDGFGLLVIRPQSLDDIETLGGAVRIEPEMQSTGNISEATEGDLVEVTGAVTRITDDLPFGYSVFIDDGSGETQVFIPATTGVNPFNLGFVTIGATVRAIGYSGQFRAQYEVLPRFGGDLLPAP